MVNYNRIEIVRVFFHYCFTIQLLLLLFPSLLIAKKAGNNDKNFPDTLSAKIALTYYNSLFCSDECQKHPVENCSKITGQPYRLMCREEIVLIRPKRLSDQWSKEQHHKGYIDLNMKEFGIEHIKAYITSVIPFISTSFKTDSYNKNTKLVTGIFKRHSFNVHTYTFKNINTGRLSSLRATPNHRFYIKNRQVFLAIKNITKKDTLITSDGSSIKRVYSDRNTQITGSDKTNSPTLVYNLEIQKKHTYFAGSDNILVHNICACKICGNNYFDTTEMKTHLEISHQLPSEDHHYKCGFERCTFETKEIEEMTWHENNQHVYICDFCENKSTGMAAAWKHIKEECPIYLADSTTSIKQPATPPYSTLSDDLFCAKMQDYDDLLPEQLLQSFPAHGPGPESSYAFLSDSSPLTDSTSGSISSPTLSAHPGGEKNAYAYE